MSSEVHLDRTSPSRHDHIPNPAYESHIPQRSRKPGNLTSSAPRQLHCAPLVTITPPTTPAMSFTSVSSSSSSIASLRDAPSSSPSHSSIPRPVPVRPGLSYPRRREQRRLLHPREHEATPDSDTPPPKNFSRPQTSQSDRFSFSSHLSTSQEYSSPKTTPSATLAVMSKPKRPRLVHNRGTCSLASSPIDGMFGRPSMERSFSSNGKHAEFAQLDSKQRSLTPDLSASVNTARQACTSDQARTSADQIRTSVDSSHSLIRRKPLPRTMPTYASRFASPLPSIPSQMSLRFSNNIADVDNVSTDSEGEAHSAMNTHGRPSGNGEVPRYTLSREQSPNNGHTRLTLSLQRTHPHRTSDPTPSVSAYYLPDHSVSSSKRASSSIGYPSNLTCPDEDDKPATPPEIPRYRSSPTLNKPLPRCPATRGPSTILDDSNRDRLSLAGASPSPVLAKPSPPAHQRSRSRQVIHKLSGIFSTKRSASQGTPHQPPTKSEKRARGRGTPTPTGDPLHTALRSPRDGDRTAQIQRIKSLVAALREEAALEGEKMNGETSRRELALRQTAQVLAETMIYSVEAEIAATKAAGEAERARRFCELAGTCAKRMLSARE